MMNVLEPVIQDPDLVSGVLDNGLSYFLKTCNSPANTVELQLVVNVGSLIEEENERGLAHFVEHMGFKGTRNFQNGQIVKYLESIGAQYGPDLNASTSLQDTTYRLSITLPEEEEHHNHDGTGQGNHSSAARMERLEAAFEVLADWAGGMLILDEDVESERAIIEEEWRGKQGPSQRLLEVYWERVFGQGGAAAYARRMPIGTLDVIRNAPPQRLREFYGRWYRPELMAVIVAGDFGGGGGGPAAAAAGRDNPLARHALALLREKFGSIENQHSVTLVSNPSPELPQFDLPRHFEKEPGICILQDSELTSSSLSLEFFSPIETSPTLGYIKAELIKRLFATLIDQRLSAISNGTVDTGYEVGPGRGQYISAGISLRPVVQDLLCVSVTAQVPHGDLSALGTLVRELERARRRGFGAAELRRARAKWRAAFAAELQDAAHRVRAKSVAADVREHFLRGRRTPLPGRPAELRACLALLADEGGSEGGGGGGGGGGGPEGEGEGQGAGGRGADGVGAEEGGGAAAIGAEDLARYAAFVAGGLLGEGGGSSEDGDGRCFALLCYQCPDARRGLGPVGGEPGLAALLARERAAAAAAPPGPWPEAAAAAAAGSPSGGRGEGVLLTDAEEAALPQLRGGAVVRRVPLRRLSAPSPPPPAALVGGRGGGGGGGGGEGKEGEEGEEEGRTMHYELSNGVRCCCRWSGLNKASVAFQAFALGGGSELGEAEEFGMSVADAAAAASGLGPLGGAALADLRGATQCRVNTQRHQYHRGLGGSAPPDRLRLLLQTLHLKLTQQPWCPRAFARILDQQRHLHTGEDHNDPEFRLMERARLLTCGDLPIMRPVTHQVIDALTLEGLAALYRRAFLAEAPAAFTFVFVGALPPPGELEPLLARYLGGIVRGRPAAPAPPPPPALPSTSPSPPPGPPGLPGPEGPEGPPGPEGGEGARGRGGWIRGGGRVPTPLPAKFPAQPVREELRLRVADKGTALLAFRADFPPPAAAAAVAAAAPPPPLPPLPPLPPGEDPRAAAALGAACRLLQARLLEVLRSRFGDIYSVVCGYGRNSLSPFGLISISFHCHPDKLQQISANLLSEIELLQKAGPTDAEVNSVKEILISNHRAAIQNNSYWLFWILDAYKAVELQSSLMSFPSPPSSGKGHPSLPFTSAVAWRGHGKEGKEVEEKRQTSNATSSEKSFIDAVEEVAVARSLQYPQLLDSVVTRENLQNTFQTYFDLNRYVMVSLQPVAHKNDEADTFSSAANNNEQQEEDNCARGINIDQQCEVSSRSIIQDEQVVLVRQEDAIINSNDDETKKGASCFIHSSSAMCLDSSGGGSRSRIAGHHHQSSSPEAHETINGNDHCHFHRGGHMPSLSSASRRVHQQVVVGDSNNTSCLAAAVEEAVVVIDFASSQSSTNTSPSPP